MSARVWREGDRVFKLLAGPEERKWLIETTAALRDRGVDTPGVRAGPDPDIADFDHVEGRDGLAAIVAAGAAILPRLLAPARTLHQAALADLPEFDPMLRIRPRLGLAPGEWRETYLARHAPIGASATPHGAIHGDLHARQLIVDATGRVWLLDLDDIARGPAEADLGNFAAHLATRPETAGAELAAGFERWLGAVLDAYPGRTNAALARRYGHIALLRRALKLAERGDFATLEALRDM